MTAKKMTSLILDIINYDIYVRNIVSNITYNTASTGYPLCTGDHHTANKDKETGSPVMKSKQTKTLQTCQLEVEPEQCKQTGSF